MKTAGSILKAIAYFDVFRYPVTAEEIYQFMNLPVTAQSLEKELNNLVVEGKIFQLDEYYSLHNDPSLVQRRKSGNARAQGLLQTAYKIGKALYKFPFVRGVGISGSLSKNFAEEDADIDFFIITSGNRLWIARTFLHALKKLSFLVGKQDWYCMNYFVDEEAMMIAEKNIFTATEVVTLKPVCGKKSLQDFYNANSWTMEHFPNQSIVSVIEIPDHKPWFKKTIEAVFANAFGSRFDNYLMNVTAKRWVQKEKHHKLNRKGNLLALIADKHFARPNPAHFQQRILENLESRLNGDLLSGE